MCFNQHFKVKCEGVHTSWGCEGKDEKAKWMASKNFNAVRWCDVNGKDNERRKTSSENQEWSIHNHIKTQKSKGEDEGTSLRERRRWRNEDE